MVKHNPKELTVLNKIYKSFHGQDAQELLTVEIPYREIPKNLVTIGVVTAIEYTPVGSSNRKGEVYRHEFGDTGGRKRVKAPVFYCTDKSKKMFYLIPSKKRHPYFSSRGVIGGMLPFLIPVFIAITQIQI